MLSVLVAVAMVKIVTCCGAPHPTATDRAYQNVFNGLYGVETVIVSG